MFTDLSDAINDINKYIEFSNVSISPWWFAECEKKYTKEGRYLRMGPKYETAIINKLFFDIDCVDKEGKIIDESIADRDKLIGFSNRSNIQTECVFSAGGYQIFISSNVICSAYTQVMQLLSLQLNVAIEDCVSTRQLRRYVGSFNFGKPKKSKRSLFCISLKKEEWGLDFETHRKLALTQRKERFKYGSNLYTPSNDLGIRPKKILDKNSDFTVDNDVDTILNKYGIEYEDICQNIRNIIEQPHVSHGQRLFIIKYLKDICFIKYGDIIILLPKLLNSKHGCSNEGYHCIEEGQPGSIYGNDYKFSPKQMRESGYCDHTCYECDDLLRELKKI